MSFKNNIELPTDPAGIATDSDGKNMEYTEKVDYLEKALNSLIDPSYGNKENENNEHNNFSSDNKIANDGDGLSNAWATAQSAGDAAARGFNDALASVDKTIQDASSAFYSFIDPSYDGKDHNKSNSKNHCGDDITEQKQTQQHGARWDYLAAFGLPGADRREGENHDDCSCTAQINEGGNSNSNLTQQHLKQKNENHGTFGMATIYSIMFSDIECKEEQNHNESNDNHPIEIVTTHDNFQMFNFFRSHNKEDEAITDVDNTKVNTDDTDDNLGMFSLHSMIYAIKPDQNRQPIDKEQHQQQSKNTTKQGTAPASFLNITDVKKILHGIIDPTYECQVK